MYLWVQQSRVKEGAGGCEDGGMAEIAVLANPEDSVAPGLVTVQSVHHVLVEVLALQLHLHLYICPPHLSVELMFISTSGTGPCYPGYCCETCKMLS